MGSLIKLSYTASKILKKKYQCKKRKKKLKALLRISIENLNYTNFINVIYDIKQYDVVYNKSLFNKCKKKYFFNDVHFESLNNFNMRFDDNYLENEQYITNIIKREIELSLSRMSVE